MTQLVKSDLNSGFLEAWNNFQNLYENEEITVKYEDDVICWLFHLCAGELQNKQFIHAKTRLLKEKEYATGMRFCDIVLGDLQKREENIQCEIVIEVKRSCRIEKDIQKIRTFLEKGLCKRGYIGVVYKAFQSQHKKWNNDIKPKIQEILKEGNVKVTFVSDKTVAEKKTKCFLFSLTKPMDCVFK